MRPDKFSRRLARQRRPPCVPALCLPCTHLPMRVGSLILALHCWGFCNCVRAERLRICYAAPARLHPLSASFSSSLAFWPLVNSRLAKNTKSRLGMLEQAEASRERDGKGKMRRLADSTPPTMVTAGSCG